MKDRVMPWIDGAIDMRGHAAVGVNDVQTVARVIVTFDRSSLRVVKWNQLGPKAFLRQRAVSTSYQVGR